MATAAKLPSLEEKRVPLASASSRVLSKKTSTPADTKLRTAPSPMAAIAVTVVTVVTVTVVIML